MDFHTLSRKELQSLCKKNKIPANITNVAMADALTALPHVEGLDEFLNPTEADGGAPAIRHSVTRRKPESTKVNSRVQRGSRAKNVEVEQDSNVNVIVLPDIHAAVVPSSNRRRKALPVSTRRKKEVDVIVIDDDDDDDGVQLKDVAKTPAALSSSRSRVNGRTARGTTTSYNTRRSVRLLEKNLSNMTLTDTQDMAPNNLEQEMDNVSDQTQDSAETQKVNDAGDSLETVSILVTEKSDELEGSSLENNTEFEECQPQADAKEEEGSGKVNDLEAELHDSNLKLDESSETRDVSNEVGSDESSELEIGTIQDALSVEAAEDADQSVAGSIPMSSESYDSGSLKELVECNADNQGSNEDDDIKDKYNEISDGKYFQSFEPMFDTDEKAEDEDLAIPEEVFEHQEEDLEAKSEYSEESMADIDKMDDVSDVTGPTLAALEVSTESSADKRNMDAENVFLESSLVDVAVHEAEDLMEHTFDVCGTSSAILAAEMDASSENSMTDIELCSNSSGDTSSIDAEKITLESSSSAGVPEVGELKDDYEKLDFKAHAEESEERAEAEELKDNSEELYFKAQAKESEEHAQAEELKDNSEKLDFKAPAEESEEHAEDNSEKLDFKAQAEVSSEEHAAGEESLDAASEFPSVLGGTCDPQIPQQISVESAGNSIEDSPDALIMSGLSCYSNTLVDVNVTSEKIAIPKQESSVLAETVAVAPINDIPIQSVVADQLKGESLFPAQSEIKEFANEIKTVPKMINTEENMPKVNMMKENLSTAELDKKSVRELKKMLKNLTLDGKPNCKSKTTNVVKEVEKKRTALQALPENRMTNGESSE